MRSTSPGPQPPLPLRAAAPALARAALAGVGLLLQGRIHHPRAAVGRRLRFPGGTTSWVYRETVVERPPAADACVLVVEFRLRWVRGRGHALFRAESWLNVPLFVGFPGLLTKWWIAADERDVYRGVYEYDGPERADAYARALWWLLAPVSEPGSIHHAVVAGARRADVVLAPTGGDGPSAVRVGASAAP